MTEAICGFRSFCSRPAGHRGHHGGWRTGVAGVIPSPYNHETQIRRGSDLSPSEVLALAEFVAHGSVAGAAACLERSEQTIKNTLVAVRHRTGAQSTIQALVALGWLKLPAEAGLTPHRNRALARAQ